MTDLLTQTGATFSPCQAYRYRLWRIWDHREPLMAFCMLNPSTADAETNDPTVERCQRRAMAAGYGGLVVVNLFALRSTDPDALYHHHDPVGLGNDHIILGVAREAKAFVCGWGTHADKVSPGRAQSVLEMLQGEGVVPHALGLTKDGHPRHPLYLPYDVAPVPMGVRP
jgi:hypothetical protein